MKLLFGLSLLSCALVWILLSMATPDGSGGWTVWSWSVWGDWSAHLTFITAFRERGFDWIFGSNPLFSGAPFQYPFLSHAILAGIADLLRADSIPVMIAASTILLAVLPFLLHGFFRGLGFDPKASLLGIPGWLFLGGFQILDSSLRTDRALTNQFESGSVLTSFLLHELIPQRAFLFGLTIFLSASLLLMRARHRPALFAGGALLCLLPLVHLHSWIVAGAFLLMTLCFPIAGSEVLGSRRSVLRVGGGVGLVSGVLAALLLTRPSSYRLSWDFWAPGWAQAADTGLARVQAMNPLGFWVYNTGLFLPLALAGFWLLRRQPAFRAPIFTGMVLFTVALLFRVQPYFYDNLKILTYACLFLAPFFGSALAAFPKRLLPVAGILLALQCAAVIRDSRFLMQGGERTSWFSSADFSIAEKFKTLRNSSSDLVLVSSIHHHWVPCLAGNPVFMGYPGWLWSWGISYSYREKELFEIWTGRARALELIAHHGIRYIVFRPGETIFSQPPNQEFFGKHFQKIHEENGWRIYSVKAAESRSPS